MKKIILTCMLMAFSCFGLFAQSTSEPICTMTLDEIALAQPFHRDHPNQEVTERIANTLFIEISAIYKLYNSEDQSEINTHRQTIKLVLDQAIEIGMNYSMFKEDLYFIDSITDKK